MGAASLKNQMTNFRVGSGIDRHNQYTTLYTSTTGNANRYGNQRNQVGEVKAKLTSVQLGRGHAYGFTTTN